MENIDWDEVRVRLTALLDGPDQLSLILAADRLLTVDVAACTDPLPAPIVFLYSASELRWLTRARLEEGSSTPDTVRADTIAEAITFIDDLLWSRRTSGRSRLVRA